MGEVEEVREQKKADMEAMKEQMATMMEAMMSMKKDNGSQCGCSCRYQGCC